MGQLPFWHSVELSAGGRPILREKEVDVHVEDNIGLYQGKSKILHRQNGRVYLTSQRLIYIDNNDTTKYSCSVELADVKTVDYSAKFLRSSPKITIFFKEFKRKNQINEINPNIKINWTCQICSSSTNEVSIKFKQKEFDQLHCDTCGIKPEIEYIKSLVEENKAKTNLNKKKKAEIACPICTFLNHPSLRHCEICGSNLPINDSSLKAFENQEIFDDRIKIETDSNDELDDMEIPLIKLSFHQKGDEVFLNKLIETIEKFEWEKLIENGNINKQVVQINDISVQQNKHNLNYIGLHGLTEQDDLQTKRNEQVINSSLDDLQTLLNKANEILEMIDSFKQLDNNGNNSEKTIYNLKQDILRDDNQIMNKKNLYLNETARKISEFLINEGTLNEEGGVITLVDLFALYNRGRIGQNLISPKELFDACSLFESLKLPLILKKINDIYVVQDLKFSNNEQIIKDIIKFILNFGFIDSFNFKYSNILKISDFFNWSLNITEEFLQIAIESGKLVIDEQIFGKHYYLNIMIDESVNESQYLEPHEEVPMLSYSQKNECITHNIETPTFPSAPLNDPTISVSLAAPTAPAASITQVAPSNTLDFTFPTVPIKQPATKPEVKISNTLLELQGLNI